MSDTMQSIRSRRTTRNFDARLLDRDVIQKILLSAVYAPFGGATGIPLRDMRRIIVLTQGTPALDEAKTLLYAAIRKNAKTLGFFAKYLPGIGKKMRPFASRLQGVAKTGIPGLDKAAHYVVVAERKGFPPVEKQSLAHAMQNMWLMATDLDVGFQLISATGMMNKNKAFMELLGLPCGQYALDGCLLGIAASKQPREREFSLDDFVSWK